MKNNSYSLFQCLYLQVGEAEVRRECTQLVFGSSTSRLNDKSSLSTIMVKITQTAKASAQIFSRAKISQEWWAFSYYVSFQMLLRKSIVSRLRLWQKRWFGLEWGCICSTYDLSSDVSALNICLFLLQLLLASLEALMGHLFERILLHEKIACKSLFPAVTSFSIPSAQLAVSSWVTVQAERWFFPKGLFPSCSGSLT